MDTAVPLDERKRQILKAVVADYTETGIPVGSHALAVHLATWSSATIRNELATLSEIGYLLQPHTSAGRVPSDLGYRYFVDFLMEEEPIPAAVRRQMDPFLADLPATLEDMLEVAAMVLAVVTDGVSIVTGPRSPSARVKHLDLVSLDGAVVLLILVFEGNLIRQETIRLSHDTAQEELSDLARDLNQELRGLDADAVAGRAAGLVPVETPAREVLTHILGVIRSVDSGEATVVVHDGVRNLLRQPEFGDVERLQEVLDILEEESILHDVLASFDVGPRVQMMIGRENGVEQLRLCSLVLTSYRAGGTRLGTIGVLGPTRMHYGRVNSRVRYVSQQIGTALARLAG